MKIIGQTKEGFIIEASKDDVAALENIYRHQKTFNVGDLIDVSQLFDEVRSVKIALDDIEKLKDATETLYDSCKWIKNFIES